MYAKPSNSGTGVDGEDDDEPEKTSSKYDGIGGKGNKQSNKEAQRRAAEEQARKKAEKIAQLKA